MYAPAINKGSIRALVVDRATMLIEKEGYMMSRDEWIIATYDLIVLIAANCDLAWQTERIFL